ncbi:MAG: hypothetical protein ABIZ49_10185, partial [Opitutaceae bacterium]
RKSLALSVRSVKSVVKIRPIRFLNPIAAVPSPRRSFNSYTVAPRNAGIECPELGPTSVFLL